MSLFIRIGIPLVATGHCDHFFQRVVTEVDVDIFDCDMDITEILLSSDGLTNMLDKEQIEKVLLGEGAVEDKVIKLIKKANNRGGTDNISVAYLVVEKEGDDK